MIDQKVMSTSNKEDLVGYLTVNTLVRRDHALQQKSTSQAAFIFDMSPARANMCYMRYILRSNGHQMVALSV